MDHTVIILTVVFGVLLLLFLGCEIWWLLRYRRTYLFRPGGHEAVVQISAQSVALYVDGLIQDEFSARNMRIVTLRAMVGGAEFRARIESRGLKPRVTATYLGKEIECLSETKR